MRLQNLILVDTDFILAKLWYVDLKGLRDLHDM